MNPSKLALAVLAAALLGPAALAQPSGPGAGRPPPKPVGGPSLALAREAAEAALAACREDGSSVAVAVTDETGAARVVLADDGAYGGAPVNAQKKAVTVLTFQMDGLALYQRMQSEPAVAEQIRADPQKFFSRPDGGRLIRVGDKVIGAVAVTGSNTKPGGPSGGQLDDGCAGAGLAVIQARLKP